MKVRVVYHFILFRWWKWIGGMVIYPFIFFKKPKEEVGDSIFRHEMEHIYQVRRDGWLKFYALHAWWTLTKGYRNNPYEVAAYEIQHTPLTDEERRIKDNN